MSGERPADWNVLDLAEWQDWQFPPVKFMVDHLLPADGLVWLGGRPKRGKSLFSLYLACCLGYGRELVADKFTIIERPRVLYICREDSGGRVQKRVEDITRAWDVGKVEPGRVRVVVRPKFDLSNAAHLKWLKAECAEYGIGFVILDTWTALSPGSDPLGAADQTKLAQALAQFTQWFEGCTLVIDHSRKNRPEGSSLSSADIMGPSQKWQAAETVIMLADTDQEGRLEVYVEGKDLDDARFFLDVSPRGSGAEKFTYAGSVEAAERARKAKGDGNRAKVKQAVLQNPKGLTQAEVQEKTGLGRTAAYKHLNALVEAQEIQREAGLYTAAGGNAGAES
jgi:hypothetical protein